MIAAIKQTAADAYATVCSPESRRLRTADRQGVPRSSPQHDLQHIRAAADWICHAQDVSGDGGVPAMYSFLEGWIGSYPETTGYIIPALFDAAEHLCDERLRGRAVRMADWLLTRQLPSGAFPGLFIGAEAGPRVFNTGQVIFGLVRAAEETRDERYLVAARRAGDWLTQHQDETGNWKVHTLNGVPHTYNTRTAWALLRLSNVTGETTYRRAALANADWALSQQCENGWFLHNGFNTNEDMVTLHTIAYAMRGLLELGAAANFPSYVDSARLTASVLLQKFQEEDHVSGAFGRDWTSAVEWRCLPGEAQLALVWMRLDQLAGARQFTPWAHEILEHVKAAQILNPGHPEMHGGVSGSVPINGAYERYCLVNWGPKFLIDALILKGRTDGGCPTG